jgi:hypothetical protein
MEIVKETKKGKENKRKQKERRREKENKRHKNKDGLTELRVGRLPDIDHAQSCLIAHEANVIFSVLVRVKPVELLAFLDGTAHLLELHILLGSEEKSMASGRFLLQLCKELPILLSKPILAY